MDINREVAGRVMRWNAICYAGSKKAFYVDVNGDDHGYVEDFNPEHSWNDMGLVIERMRELGFYYHLITFPDSDMVLCLFRRMKTGNGITMIRDTAQLAVSLAALKALEQTNELS